MAEVKENLSDIVSIFNDLQDSTNTSLTRFVKRSIVISRAYIDDVLANEEILSPVMMNLLDLYVSLVLTAMNLNFYVSSTQRVRDVLGTVATEDLKPVTNIKNELNNYFDTSVAKKTIFGMEAETAGSTKVVATALKDQPLPTGRVISVNINSANVTGDTGDATKTQKVNATVNILVQIHPLFVTQEVSSQFIAMNFKPSFTQRWFQMTAGEISFWSDFVLGMDLRRQKYNALRKDKTGALKDMEERKDNAVGNYWLKLLQVNKNAQNIANTILIYEAKNLKKACSNSGISFDRFASRQKFFTATMSMMVVSVDTMYSKIRIYYNGIDTFSELTFEQCKRNAKTESTDIMSMMKQYAQGLAPKF